MKVFYKMGGLVMLTLLAISCGVEKSSDEELTEKEVVEVKPAPVLTDLRIVMKTDKGAIAATMFASKAPITVAAFLNLARRGFYDGLSFHRVVEDFVIQGGDPDGDGEGGPGYFLPNEIDPDLKHDKVGVFSMARKSKPDTAGSQFFITLGVAEHLDGGYSIFGEVTEGIEVVESIEVGDKILGIEVLDSTEALFAAQAENLTKWNGILDQRAVK
ncbi:MAG: peptidylprolyl isomerase [Verrucomicrobiales bacterium]|nr:peptidylprolyl isomerase [Verrucomicrobiales bacterium]